MDSAYRGPFYGLYDNEKFEKEIDENRCQFTVFATLNNESDGTVAL